MEKHIFMESSWKTLQFHGKSMESSWETGGFHGNFMEKGKSVLEVHGSHGTFHGSHGNFSLWTAGFCQKSWKVSFRTLSFSAVRGFCGAVRPLKKRNLS